MHEYTSFPCTMHCTCMQVHVCKKGLVTLTLFWSPHAVAILLCVCVCVCVCVTHDIKKKCLEFEIRVSFVKSVHIQISICRKVSLILHICPCLMESFVARNAWNVVI